MQINDDDKYKEECGVVGIFSNLKINLSSILYTSLNALQHRGQESCGFTYSDGDELICHKDMGLVSNIFMKNDFSDIKGFSAIGHVRYSTFGESSLVNAQPILDKFSFEQIALAHNGNITNAAKVKKSLVQRGLSFNTTTDSEVILKLIEDHYAGSMEETLITISSHITGGYAAVILTKNSLYAMRDHSGIRPLCIGKLKDGHMVCSESCALDMVNGEFIRDVAPGEIIKIDKNGIKTINSVSTTICTTCAFEYIYFARSDSRIDGVSVYNSRLKAGALLFTEHPCAADIVIGVPDSGTTAALGYSRASSIPYEIGFVKNNYVGRTFITPSQAEREAVLSMKFSVIKENIKGKKVVVVDDSIVRGTTCKRIISKLKEAGAKEIHYRLASPTIKSPCCLGINTRCKKELISSNMTIEQINNFIGADSLGYLSIDGLLTSIKGKSTCLNCFK